jgi:hypothetical protein
MAITVIHRDITTYDKSAHLLICSPAMKIVSVPIQTDLSSTFLQIAFDPVYRQPIKSPGFAARQYGCAHVKIRLQQRPNQVTP